MKTQRKYGRVHKKGALTHKKRKLSKKTLKRKNKNRVKSRRRKTRKYKKRGGRLTNTLYGIGSSLTNFPSAVEEEEVYGFREMCDPGYQLVKENEGDASFYKCVEDDRQLGKIQNKTYVAEKPELTFEELGYAAGVDY